ncbi:hypothetical protein A3C75_03300 [Candidatus Giovannonibacteria bacterium RIFCSPHIGHO2_02_FULL_44_31]|uniref:Glycosyl transferase family 1 domain-containing protein n=1 Tax=Candidatus Giovannonibacteria bacterium RIFCSPLOWO2_12_FULL_44_15 TaxID=1798364 RepID=A0A1F5Y0T2_9BACT|nr:MAG: hypothetical protein A3C75_03300 [Candidatus Giovannonibacteria bacterium RIFCSPHIGHO2_02_FULL_44_31]OGF76671.1 MAG: hypothetical protein A3E62_03510 [Candidatus Giovannonibacteria bacterium RIFCSPHIGHO2_12_FULL_44_29]OGF93757.1 MAG: hypothetical protein A3G54_04370 [Candidatus Giovannonibacteria bacterium RIFCSPLOWO2_12_FULL_44_15]
MVKKAKMKTVLLTLSSPAVFRNLFFFPESAFFQLKDCLNLNKNLRAVFLVYPKDYNKYAYLFKDNIGGRLILEEITVKYPKTFLEKIFRFFYSYLIYTGTTRLMASIGTRPDEPPAGGRAYLAPLKRFISVTFGRSSFIRLKLIPSLFLVIIKDRPFKKFFDRYNPELIFISHLYGWFDALLLAEAKRRNIPTIGMPAGWDHLDKYYLPFKVDSLLIPSEQMKQAAILHQSYKPESVQIIGHPYFDFITDQEYWFTREKLFESLKFPSGAKFILYISGSAYCPDEPDIIETILKWADEKKFEEDVYLVLRPYLGGRSKDREFDEKKFEGFHNHPRVRFYQRESWADLDGSIYYENLMRHADAIITVYSTAFLEAAAFDRPLLAIAFDGYKKRPFNRSLRRFELMEHFKEVIKTGALKTARDFEELFKILNDYFRDPSIGHKERERVREEFCYKLDGQASRRLIEVVMSKL